VNESRMSPMERLTRNKPVESEIEIDELEEDLSNTFAVREEPKMIIEEKVPPKIQRTTSSFMQKDKVLTDEDDDDELEIPAFIRRKMGK
jgi:hypothetical protein